MNGLDAILESILSDARGQASAITADAAAEAGGIQRQAETEAEALLQSMETAALAEAAALRSRAESSAAMSARRTVLDARRHAVSHIVDRAVEHLAGLPSEEKVRLYTGFLRDARGGETVVFSAADLAGGVAASAVAAARKARLDAGLPDVVLTVSDTPGSFLGGLVLRRGLIEDNLTFEMLTRQSREDLEAYAATLIEK